MSTTKRITKRLLAVILTVLMLMSMVAIGITSVSAATITGGTTLYLKPNSNWTQASARFAAYFCNGSSAATWIDMELVPGETSTYQVTVPDGQSHKNVIFCRMNPATTANNFNTGVKWNQSGDLTWDGSKNLCTINSGQWDCGTNVTWSAYTPPAPANPGDASGWNIIGDFNGDTFTKLNSLVYAEDTSIATLTMELDKGTYKFKVADDAKSSWLGYATLAPELTNGGTISSDGTNDDNVKLVADGGIYTFNYTIATKKLEIAYEAVTVDAPATLSAATVVPAVVEGTTGDGTEVNPYIVNCNIPNTELTITATPNGEATGFVYAIDDGDQVTVDAGTWTATTSVATPANEASKKVTVQLWAYNSKLGTTVLSDPITKEITIKGFDTVVKMPVELDVTGWAEDGATYTVQYILPATDEGDGVAAAAEAANVEEMTPVEGETNIYTANIPEATTQVIFSKTVGETTISTDAIDISTDSNRYAIAGVTEEGTVTGDWYVEPPFSKTAYFINSAKWEAVTAHIWTEGGDIPDLTTWPGMEMTKTEDTVNGYDVYSVTVDEDYQNIIFNNNGGGQKTDDLTFEDGQYYYLADKKWYPSLEEVPAIDPLATNRYLLGGFNSWNATANEFKLNAVGDTTGYVTLTLEANTTYEFKVIREGTWESCATPITDTVDGLTFSSSVSDNAKITTTVAGDYTFGFGIDNSKLSVTYPEVRTIYLNVGDFWTVAEGDTVSVNDSIMTADADGIYSAEIAVADTIIDFALTKTVDDMPQVTKLTVDAEEGNLFTLTAADAGEWTEYVTDPVITYRDIYLKVNDWAEEGATYAVKAVVAATPEDENTPAVAAEGDDEWTAMTELANDAGTYTAKIDETATSLVFKKSIAAEDETVVESTFTVGVDPESDLYTIDSIDAEGNVTGTWGTYTAPVPEPVTVYFQNNWMWSEVSMYAYSDTVEYFVEWPGTAMELYGNDGNYDIYKVEVPGEATNIIFNGLKDDNSGDRNQSPSITEIVENRCYYMVWDATTNSNQVGYEDISVILPPVVEKETIYFNVNGVVELVEGDVITVNGVEMEADGNMYSAEIEVADEIVFEITSGETVTTITAIARDSEGQNYYTLTGVVEEAIAGTWSEYIPYVDPLATNVVLVGTFNNWIATENEFKLKAEGEKVGYTTLTLESGTYTFKIIDNDAWLGNNGTIDVTCEGWTFEEGKGNCTFNALAGTYTFSFDTETKKLTIEATDVEYPVYSVTFNEGNFTVAGEAKVTYGNDYAFTVEPDVGYVITQVLNGEEELTAVDGVYTITNVKSDINITINTETDKVLPNQVFSAIYLDINGNIIAADKRVQGTEVKLLPGPAVEGHTFKGWTPVPETLKEDGTFILDKDYVFTPVYEEDNNDLPLLPGDPEVPDEPTVKTWTVIFVDDSGKYLGYQTVEDGKDATPPEAPAKAGYTFSKWDGEYTNVTSNRKVTAIYTKNTVTPPAPATTGSLKVDVTGGSGFTITVGGVERPQGTTYYNSQMPINVSVTLVASSTNDNEFLGWMNEYGVISSKSETLTFTTSGNDVYKAVYKTQVANTNLVIFNNDRAASNNGQILDMQYYVAGDEIVFPKDPTLAGYTFDKWDHTADDIQTKLAAGQNVTVVPTWDIAEVYVDITVNNGKVTAFGSQNAEGKYLALRGTTVEANAAPEGQKFAYWVDDNNNIKSYNSSYKFFPATDTVLTAIYVDENVVVEKKVLADVVADGAATDTTGVKFIYNWYVPEKYTFVGAGIIFINKEYYNESTFAHGSGAANMIDYKPTATGVQIPENTYQTTKSSGVTVGQTWVVACWVTYKDANGVEHTVHSEHVEVTRL